MLIKERKDSLACRGKKVIVTWLRSQKKEFLKPYLEEKSRLGGARRCGKGGLPGEILGPATKREAKPALANKGGVKVGRTVYC